MYNIDSIFVAFLAINDFDLCCQPDVPCRIKFQSTKSNLVAHNWSQASFISSYWKQILKITVNLDVVGAVIFVSTDDMHIGFDTWKVTIVSDNHFVLLGKEPSFRAKTGQNLFMRTEMIWCSLIY